MSDYKNITDILNFNPEAFAIISGSEKYPRAYARINFYKNRDGVLVTTKAQGLPEKQNGRGVLGFHIHSGGSCTGDNTDPFKNALTHYNPEGNLHPYHAGDMPPLFCEGGEAFSAFLTKRFKIEDIIGKTVIIHSMPDDFTTQPAGNSGEKIACGIIRKTESR